MKINCRRNWIAVLAIILTTVLFTSLFVGADSMVRSKLAADQKQYSSWAHAVLQKVTEEESQSILNILQRSSFVERVGINMFVGTLQDERILFQTEVRALDKNAVAALCNMPIQGRLPEKKNEIALSSLVLDALGIPYEMGSEIALCIGLDNADLTDKQMVYHFSLCGWWEGDVLDYSQYAWVSLDFAKEITPQVTRTELENGAMSGAINFCIWYKNLWNLEKKTEELSRECGFLETGARDNKFQVNPAYQNLVGEGGISVSGVFCVVLLIVLAGYLIIYNIFSISVKSDIRVYGLLKNVGTTGKQLAWIVRIQVFCLCLAGIPTGLFAGYGGGVLISPALAADIDSLGQLQNTIVNPNPLIFIISAVFALVTVYLSCFQACRIVTRVSPVEALHIADSRKGFGRKRSIYKEWSVSWWGMALRNFMQNWKRGGIVIVSIAISLVTLNGIFVMVQGYNLDSYKSSYMAADFALDQLPDYAAYATMNGITVEIQEILRRCPYAEKVGFVRYSEEYHEMEPQLRQVWDKIAQERLSGEWKKRWEQMKIENKMKIVLMGIDEPTFDKLLWNGEPHTWEEFYRGDCIIVDSPLLAGKGAHNYEEGDNFCMEYQNKIVRDYSVLGEARLPYSLDYPYANLVAVTVMIPAKEFVVCTESTDAMRAFADAMPGLEKEMQQYLEEQILAKDTTIILHSILDLQASFERFLNKYYYVGGALIVVLATIGIMNFWNMIAVSILSRRREFALLDAVGMTRKQLRRMLVVEGGLYLGGAIVLEVFVTYVFGKQLLTAVLGQAFFLQMKVTVLPSILILPLLAAVIVFLPCREFQKVLRFTDKGNS